ncbi:MAG: OsmC family protein [Rhodospirillaceae bacterium]|jgi:putative redox protein|nr:OsmC family protein [Rhodospirillaceae bacterium]MBT4588499.1 OsmC family protein [Rhodospirillaceae bacterium]MBT4938198.1 OsmC family protein [Rhodospirillaceae bacterium]MBT7266389.1 OsmC family protein [Rhodospirillaceae bacterium]
MATIKLKEKPEGNSRTAKSVNKAGTVRCDIAMDNHNIIIDEPPERGGKDEAASPLLHFSAALASCQTVQIVKVAEAMRLNFGDIKIDAIVNSGGGDGREQGSRILRFVSAKMIISIETDASEAKVERLKQLAIDRCPIGALLEDGGVEPEVEWHILPLT